MFTVDVKQQYNNNNNYISYDKFVVITEDSMSYLDLEFVNTFCKNFHLLELMFIFLPILYISALLVAFVFIPLRTLHMPFENVN